MADREKYIDGVKKGGLFQGKKELLRHLDGKRLTQREAIKAHCYDCMGHYSSGAEDCQSDVCSLRPFMPYLTKAKAKNTHRRTDTSRIDVVLKTGRKTA